MMVVKPKFYAGFKCIASACPDTCCAGWEIEVDEDSHEYYGLLDKNDRDFVYSRLFCGENGEHLLCREGARCAFLRSDNLCELILRFGEDALCDICREHPRFYSETENITEVGVGLCCPEAARLWLSESCGFLVEDDGYAPDADEKELYDRQMRLIAHVTDGGGSLGERLFGIIGEDGDGVDLYGKLCELYSGIELMDVDFPKRFSTNVPHVDDAAFEKLAAYFIYRYFFELGEELCIRFTAASLIIIASMGGDIAVAAKDYSKEVEYDTDNLEVIYAFLVKCRGLGTLTKEIFGDVI